MNWNILLFASKWAFIALVYFVLFLLLVTVRREFGLRIGGSQPAAPTIARLRVINPGNSARVRPGMQYDLTSETSLGAAPDNQVILPDPYISNHHARLRFDGSAWWLEDLGSRNGTVVDGKRCLPYQPMAVRPGSNIQFGDMVLQLFE